MRKRGKEREKERSHFYRPTKRAIRVSEWVITPLSSGDHHHQEHYYLCYRTILSMSSIWQCSHLVGKLASSKLKLSFLLLQKLTFVSFSFSFRRCQQRAWKSEKHWNSALLSLRFCCHSFTSLSSSLCLYFCYSQTVHTRIQAVFCSVCVFCYFDDWFRLSVCVCTPSSSSPSSNLIELIFFCVFTADNLLLLVCFFFFFFHLPLPPTSAA